MKIKIRFISATETLDVRHPILRTGLSRQNAILPHDKHKDSIHLGAFINNMLVAVSSLFHEDQKGNLEKGIWRLRAMAVLKEHQGEGIGKEILLKSMDVARSKNASMLWCTARSHAAKFYEKCGFHKEGNEFEIAGAGPHFIYVLSMS